MPRITLPAPEQVPADDQGDGRHQDRRQTGVRRSPAHGGPQGDPQRTRRAGGIRRAVSASWPAGRGR